MDLCFLGGLLMLLGGLSLIVASFLFLGLVLATAAWLLSFQWAPDQTSEWQKNQSRIFPQLIVYAALGVSCFVLSEITLDVATCPGSDQKR